MVLTTVFVRANTTIVISRVNWFIYDPTAEKLLYPVGTVRGGRPLNAINVGPPMSERGPLFMKVRKTCLLKTNYLFTIPSRYADQSGDYAVIDVTTTFPGIAYIAADGNQYLFVYGLWFRIDFQDQIIKAVQNGPDAVTVSAVSEEFDLPFFKFNSADVPSTCFVSFNGAEVAQALKTWAEGIFAVSGLKCIDMAKWRSYGDHAVEGIEEIRGKLEAFKMDEPDDERPKTQPKELVRTVNEPANAANKNTTVKVGIVTFVADDVIWTADEHSVRFRKNHLEELRCESCRAGDNKCWSCCAPATKGKNKVGTIYCFSAGVYAHIPETMVCYIYFGKGIICTAPGLELEVGQNSRISARRGYDHSVPHVVIVESNRGIDYTHLYETVVEKKKVGWAKAKNVKIGAAIWWDKQNNVNTAAMYRSSASIIMANTKEVMPLFIRGEEDGVVQVYLRRFGAKDDEKK